MKTFGHVLYFSEDLLLPPPYTYFSIDFKDISSTIVAKVGGGKCAPKLPKLPMATPLMTVYLQFIKNVIALFCKNLLL